MRAQTSLGWWEMVRRPARAPLRGAVLGYTGFEEHTRAPLRRTEVPSTEITVIVSLGPRIDVDGATLTSFAAGLHQRPSVTEHAGEQLGIEIRLAPLAGRALLGVPMGELANRVVALDDLLGRAAGELAERLHDAPGWDARFALLDAVLGERLAAAAAPSPAVAQAWDVLAATDGRVAVGRLAAELGWSRRHLTARFREEVGLAPKALARVLRFQHARAALLDGAAPADAALDAGYYDQAHFNRDFRAFAGAPPTAYLARRLPGDGGVAAPGFPSVQDGAAAAA